MNHSLNWIYGEKHVDANGLWVNLGKTKTMISGKTYTHLKILVKILVVYVVKKLEVVQPFELDANIDIQEF